LPGFCHFIAGEKLAAAHTAKQLRKSQTARNGTFLFQPQLASKTTSHFLFVGVKNRSGLSQERVDSTKTLPQAAVKMANLPI
jgi:hypothetical protein